MEAAFGDLVAFQLRLGHPVEDVVVAADVAHEVHGLAAARIAIAGLAVPLLLRQAWQHLLHIQPLVRVQSFGLGQLAGVAQVGDADVVGRQGEPGAIRLFQVFGQATVDQCQVLAATHDALSGVEAVGHAHGLGGTLGQHHQAAHAGLGGGLGLPQRFLIADGGQQAPVDLVLLGGLFEVLLVARQTLLQVLGEGVGADVAEYIDMPVVALLEALQAAVFLDQGEKVVGLLQQAGVGATGNGPRQVVGVAQVKGDAHVGEVHLVHRQFVGVDQGQVDLSFVDHAQQVNHFDGGGFFVFQFGQGDLQLGQLFGVAAALQHQDALADQICRARGAWLTIAIDNLRGDLQVGLGELCLGLASWAVDQARSGQYRAVCLVEAAEQVIKVVGGLDLQIDAKVFGEALDQFVFEAGLAVAVLEIGGRAVAGDHP